MATTRLPAASSQRRSRPSPSRGSDRRRASGVGTYVPRRRGAWETWSAWRAPATVTGVVAGPSGLAAVLWHSGCSQVLVVVVAALGAIPAAAMVLMLGVVEVARCWIPASADLRRARDEGRALRVVTKAAVSGPHSTAAAAKEKRAAARGYANDRGWQFPSARSATPQTVVRTRRRGEPNRG